MEGTSVTPWALDVDGRDLVIGDRVAYLTPGPLPVMHRGNVMSFQTTEMDPMTGEIDSSSYWTYVAWDDHSKPRLGVRADSLTRLSRNGPQTDPVRAAEDHLSQDHYHPGDVVGVLENGPRDLQGRAGEVVMLAWSDQPQSGMGTRPADVLLVVCDGGREAWCTPEQVVMVYPTPEPGRVSEPTEAAGW